MVKRARLKISSLSGFRGSNPLSCTRKMIEDIAIFLVGFGELFLLVTSLYAIYWFFVSGEISALIVGIGLFILFVFGIVYWIKKKESFFTYRL